MIDSPICSVNLEELLDCYRGRINFYKGLSTKKTLLFGTPEDEKRNQSEFYGWVKTAVILLPAHAVEGDVSLENMLAFIEEVEQQTK